MASFYERVSQVLSVVPEPQPPEVAAFRQALLAADGAASDMRLCEPAREQIRDALVVAAEVAYGELKSCKTHGVQWLVRPGAPAAEALSAA